MNHKPSLTTPLKANNTPSSRMFLRKVSKLIVHEQWYELDHFLRSPREGVTAFRSGMYVAKSLPRLQDTNELSGLNDMMDSSPFDTETASGGNDLSPMEVVHFACRFNPPRTIIRHLSSMYPEGVKAYDKMGRLPLHHACKWGSSYRLICFLVENDPSAASWQDSLGKTPLHLLCEHYTDAFKPNNVGEYTSEECMIQAINILLEQAPESPNIEDYEGTSPLEYAIGSVTPYKVVRCLQKASERDWKEWKKTSFTHAKIEEERTRNQQQKQHEQEANRGNHQLNEDGQNQYDIAHLHSSLGRVNLHDVEESKSSSSVRPPLPPSRQLVKQSSRSKYAMSA
eukprot:g9932.t1 g9932   contig4:904018-905230(+)